MTRRLALLVLSLVLLAMPDQAAAAQQIKAVAFDYFVIFDPNSVVPVVEQVFPGKGLEFTKQWRAKQFEYGFLRSITHRHADFYRVTEDALTYTAAAQQLALSPENKQKLLQAYLTLKPWPDTVAGLRRLKAAGIRIITIANFSAKMLHDNADNAGITDLFDELLSTEVNGTYKPDPQAYALGMQHLGLKRDEMIFAAFGGWDAYGARNFGYTTFWVNRLHLPPEELGLPPDGTADNMTALVDFVLAH